MISHAFWQRRFGGDPNIVGRMLNLNNTPTQIVGVMPADFKFPRLEIDLWTPLALDAKRTAPYFFSVVGRLKPGLRKSGKRRRTRLECCKTLVASTRISARPSG